jgi:spermidine dehydrogenase
MNEQDHDLGMDSDISRRDFLDGAARIIGGAAVASAVGPVGAALPPNPAAPTANIDADYPPMRQGLRGFNPEAMEAGHLVRDGKVFGDPIDTKEVYDLVVVGAGMAGLSAAYFYRKQIPGAKILVLDGCDDFGGHARRVEFNVDGKQLLSNGGTVGIWNPNTYSPEAAALLKDIGIDRDRYYRQAAADVDPVAKLGLGSGHFFGKEVYGIDRLVPNRPSGSRDAEKWREFFARTPMSDATQTGFLKLYTGKEDYMPGVSVDEKVRQLRKMTYVDYLTHIAKIHPDVVAEVLRQGGVDNSNQAAGHDTCSAWYAWRRGELGFDGMGLPKADQSSTLTSEPGEHVFFPDGNAGVARLLMRWLIPDALPGSTMEDSIVPHVQYARFDLPTNDVRIRLSSTAIRVKHLGDPPAARAVEITYIREGRPYRVRAAATVMACFNAIIPYLMPELPESQKAALHHAVRKPLVYTRVALRNWKAFQKLGVARVSCPGMFYQYIGLEARPFWGDALSGWGKGYQFPENPDDPVIVNMELSNEILEMHGSGLPPREQWKAARAKLQAISFETMERNIRSQLQRVLGPGGLDPRRDIAGIIVSRWGHGYATGTNELYDPDWTHRTDAPWIVGRQRFGRVAISNTDSAAVSLTNAAFAQSHRAVMEIVNDVVRPVYDFEFSERDTVGLMGDYPNKL